MRSSNLPHVGPDSSKCPSRVRLVDKFLLSASMWLRSGSDALWCTQLNEANVKPCQVVRCDGSEARIACNILLSIPITASLTPRLSLVKVSVGQKTLDSSAASSSPPAGRAFSASHIKSTYTIVIRHAAPHPMAASLTEQHRTGRWGLGSMGTRWGGAPGEHDAEKTLSAGPGSRCRPVPPQANAAQRLQ